MNVRLSMLTLSIALAVASAQERPQNPPSQETPQRTTPANPQTATQPDTKASTSTGSESTKLPEMKTSTFKGVLVDMSCSSSTSASAATTGRAPQSSDEAKSPTYDQSNTANRSASDSSCPVTANSSQLGLKLDDGRTVRFDLVGNQRAQDALKNDKRWNKDISANKPLRVKVSGVLNGDKLIVASIH